MTTALPQPDKARILLVDDVRANRLAMRRLLARVDADIVEAASGEEALSACLEHPFALILLDVQMPGMDGFEVAELLSGQGDLSDTPVIFVTANHTDDLDHLQGYRLGAVDYLVKPINETVLLAKIRAFLDLYRARGEMQRLLRQVELYNDRLQEEVRERKRAEARALHQAHHDPLTDLPNRARFYQALEQALATARATVALIYIDLDGFKAVNDTYGHAAGDALLCAVAGRLRRAFREDDIVARLGGDEFAVLMTGIDEAHRSVPERQAKAVVQALAQPFRLPLDGVTVQVGIGASAGVAYGFAAGSSADTLMAAGDHAMYRAKHEGKGRVCVAPAGDTPASAS
ncbi:diguanylate cyclase [Algiphilus sp.]|uniref:diguanylate cyclase domain-containing protein n=1 Tax=Algiphilus sp. TaxID=1872431 RepID=UPI002A5E82E2|nr:diguanylate cyclase [Pseudomonadota bacterium]